MLQARRSMGNPMQGPPQGALYDTANGDYEAAGNYQDQNFGNPYDCPEGMYGGSMVSSVGYSKVSDHVVGGPKFQGPAFVPEQHHPNPGPGAQAMQDSYAGDTGTVVYKPGPAQPMVGAFVPPPPQQQQQQQQPQHQMAPSGRGPLPRGPEDESFPPPPPTRGSADNSLNDSNSTTQSNLASECSEAECDREPLVKNRGGAAAAAANPNRASAEQPDMTTEEMRRLLERNEVINPNNGPKAGLKPFDSANV